jgi:hypothetical protein
MDPIDQLPPDQSAVLSLLLRQGRSYGDIAALLGIAPDTVRQRAHAALDAIAGDTVEPPTRATTRAPTRPRAPSPRGPDGPSPRRPSGGAPRPSGSRRAGALLLAAIVAVVIVAVVLIANNSGGSSHGSTGTSSSSSTTSTGASSTPAATGTPHIDKQLALTSPDPSSSAAALVEIVSEGSKRAFLLSAEHLPTTAAGSFYAAWLYNSPSHAAALGRAPNVSSDGKLQAVGALPGNASSFHTMLLTRETSTHPTHPGPIVLSGAFSVH